jgi:hypothetical protein
VITGVCATAVEAAATIVNRTGKERLRMSFAMENPSSTVYTSGSFATVILHLQFCAEVMKVPF